MEVLTFVSNHPIILFPVLLVLIGILLDEYVGALFMFLGAASSILLPFFLLMQIAVSSDNTSVFLCKYKVRGSEKICIPNTFRIETDFDFPVAGIEGLRGELSSDSSCTFPVNLKIEKAENSQIYLTVDLSPSYKKLKKYLSGRTKCFQLKIYSFDTLLKTEKVCLTDSGGGK
jgi:hypothetical protein